jgi:DNA polymerase (family 10)
MNNQRLAQLFYELADLQDILGIEWKPIAFRKAARNIETLNDDVADIFKKGGLKALEDIPGVGEAIAKKTVEFLEKGTFDEIEKTRKMLPEGIIGLMHIRGVGPKTVKVLYDKLKIHSVDQLEKAARSGKIRTLGGFGEKSEQDILESIEFMRKGDERVPLGKVLPLARTVLATISKVDGVEKAMIGGSVRRMRESCKDIDILVLSRQPGKVMDAFTSMPNVEKITGRGDTKSSVLLEEGLPVDVRVVPAKSFGAALQYFTGSKEHNVRLRQLALRKGFSLSEYGLFTVKGKKYVCGRTEEEVYKRIGAPFVPPEIRENAGEFDLRRSPDLIPYGSLKGDLHTHSIWSDGVTRPQAMVDAARDRGYEYIALTDHSVSEVQAHGMDAKRLLAYVKELRLLQKKNDDIDILIGSEVDIKPDGSLDYPDRLLGELDIVIASVHSSFRQDADVMTKRIVNALSNDHVTILGHPTTRLIGARPAIDFDADTVFQAAKDNDVLLEINGNPLRMDLTDTLCRKAKDIGCRFVVCTDSHHPDQLAFEELGIAVARRGWLDKKDVANTLPWKRFSRLVGI